MKKRMVSVLLAGAMAATLFAGCGNDGGSGENGKSGSASGTEAASTADGYAAEIDMDEDPYTVAIQLVVLPGVDYSSFEGEMETALNEITEPAINCDVDVQFVSIAEVANTTSLAVAGDEKVDLLHVATVSPLSSMVGSDLLLDMNEDNLIQNRGKGLTELFGDLMECGDVNGQQLAVPAKTYNAAAKGVAFNKTILDALGISVPETGTMDDVEAVLYEFAEKAAGTEYEDVMPMFIGKGETNFLYWFNGYNGFGTECSYGAVIDETSDKLTVENLYATDLFRDYALRMYKWRQDGIIQKNSTDETSAQDYNNAQSLLTSVGDITPQLNANYDSQAKAAGFEWTRMTLVDYQITNSVATEYMWGIAANSRRPDKAMDFLNLMYTDADVANILLYGVEGTNYDFADGSTTVINTNGSYISSFVQAGDQDSVLIQAPNDDTYVDQWKTAMDAATESKLLGYMFDDSAFQTEASVIHSVILQYLPTLQNGLCGSEEATGAYIDEFVAALENAGINDVIAANQEQLDAFLAAK